MGSQAELRVTVSLLMSIEELNVRRPEGTAQRSSSANSLGLQAGLSKNPKPQRGRGRHTQRENKETSVCTRIRTDQDRQAAHQAHQAPQACLRLLFIPIIPFTPKSISC